MNIPLKKFLIDAIAVLSAAPAVGGLELGDTGLRFINANEDKMQSLSLRLPPGIMEEGRVLDRAALIDALGRFRKDILGPHAPAATRINVVAVMASVRVYTQVFSLPLLQGDELEKAIALNLQMISPLPASESYMSYEVLPEIPGTHQREVFAVFIERTLAEELRTALEEAGFAVVALESKALALSRLIKEKASGTDHEQSVIAVHVDGNGVDVAVVRAGRLYFDYFHSWKGLQGDAKSLTMEVVRDGLLRNVRQVVNYYGAHFKDPLAAIVVSATGLKSEILAALEGQFTVPVRELALAPGLTVAPEAFVAFGGALRGLMSRRKDTAANLLGLGVPQAFFRERIRSFLRFWRFTAPLALAILFLALFISSWSLGRLASRVGTQGALRITPEDSRIINDLSRKASALNASIAALRAVNEAQHPFYGITTAIFDAAVRGGVTIDRITASAAVSGLTIAGEADSQDDILAFKKELSLLSSVRDIQLPVSEIKKTGDGYRFSMTLLESSAATP